MRRRTRLYILTYSYTTGESFKPWYDISPSCVFFQKTSVQPSSSMRRCFLNPPFNTHTARECKRGIIFSQGGSTDIRKMLTLSCSSKETNTTFWHRMFAHPGVFSFWFLGLGHILQLTAPSLMILYCSLFAVRPPENYCTIWGCQKIMKINLTFSHGSAADDVSIKALQRSDLWLWLSRTLSLITGPDLQTYNPVFFRLFCGALRWSRWRWVSSPSARHHHTAWMDS